MRSASTAENKTTAEYLVGLEDFIAANQIAIDKFKSKHYGRRLTIYRAADDKFDTAESIKNGLGWAPIAAAGFDVIDVPGDHLGILDWPNIRTLGAQIQALLASLHDNQD